jgi:L-rhamnose mutarotase
MRVKHAALLRIRPQDAAEYERRHDDIWPEMAEHLRSAGITDYTIHLDPETGYLFAVQWRDETTAARVNEGPVPARWRAHMADLLIPWPETGDVAKPLQTVFSLAGGES